MSRIKDHRASFDQDIDQDGSRKIPVHRLQPILATLPLPWSIWYKRSTFSRLDNTKTFAITVAALCISTIRLS